MPEDGDWRTEIRSVPQITWTDCKSLHDMLHKDGAMPTERLVALDVYDIRQYLDEDDLEWVPTAAMLADPLTKHFRSSNATDLKDPHRKGQLDLSH